MIVLLAFATFPFLGLHLLALFNRRGDDRFTSALALGWDAHDERGDALANFHLPFHEFVS